MHNNPFLHALFLALIDYLKYSVLFLLAGWLLHMVSGFLRRSLSSSIGQNSFNLIFAPGIMIHEISHALAALLFMHEVVDIKLFDWKASKGSHGHVMSRPRNLHVFFRPWIKLGDLFIGIAPIILGPFLCLLFFYYLVPGGKQFLHLPHLHNFPRFTWVMAVWIYLTTAVLSQMELSEADLKGTWKGYFWLTFLWLLGAALFLKFKNY